MKIFVRICMIVVSISIPLTCILGAGVLVSRMPDFYSYEFSKLQSIENADVHVKEKEMASLFSDYINGKVDTFQITESYNGEERELFTQKEQQHMADVKALINSLTIVFVISAILLVAGGWALIYQKSKRQFRRSYCLGACIYGVIAALLAGAALIDFTAGFTVFHKLFFTNDLWMLDPKRDILLMIMPEKFFSDGAVAVLIISALILAIFGYIIWRMTRERKMFYEN